MVTGYVGITGPILSTGGGVAFFWHRLLLLVYPDDGDSVLTGMLFIFILSFIFLPVRDRS